MSSASRPLSPQAFDAHLVASHEAVDLLLRQQATLRTVSCSPVWRLDQAGGLHREPDRWSSPWAEEQDRLLTEAITMLQHYVCAGASLSMGGHV